MDTTTAPLLIELGTEELPPKSLRALRDAFANNLHQELNALGLISIDDTTSTNEPDYQAFATPRRLAIVVKAVKSQQEKQIIEKLGPNIKAAYDSNGEPTAAALGFAKSCQTHLKNIQSKQTDKGERLSHTFEQEGKILNELINTVLNQAIKRLPIAKKMRWGNHDDEFVRPVHWLNVLHGDKTVTAQTLGLKSNNVSYGHRFHYPKAITINNADSYESQLKNKGKVITDFNARLKTIQQQCAELAEKVNGRAILESSLLDEVTSMVELPNALLGGFSSDYLTIPAECLISSMRDHQKYFHIEDKNGNLMPYFITVSNIDSKDPKSVISGNERVLNARLADAQFFWEVDKKQTLESRVDKLAHITFHQKLGSVLDKTNRLVESAGKISQQLDADKTLCQRAALLCKADLNSDMVNEFDELQGIMGSYYAKNDQENEIVAQAIEQHYRPKFSGDILPEDAISNTVALADRLDNLLGIFYSQEIPTGDKDPYGLRRAALSILRILIEKKYDLSLSELIKVSAASYQNCQNIIISAEIQQQVCEYIASRFLSFYQNQSISTNTIHSVMATNSDNPLDFHNRLLAVHEFSHHQDAADLIAANKRIGNIIKKTTSSAGGQIDVNLLQEASEVTLFEAINELKSSCHDLFSKKQYVQGLGLLATLRLPIDDFFENVMVLVENQKIKENRIALLVEVRQLFLEVADISYLQSS